MSSVACARTTMAVRVEMRWPRSGERGWWVRATTPEEALAEALRDGCIEAGEVGWPASGAEEQYNRDADLRAVTLILEAPTAPWEVRRV